MGFRSLAKRIDESLDAMRSFDDGVKRTFLAEAYAFPPGYDMFKARDYVMASPAWNDDVKNMVGALLTYATDPTDIAGRRMLFADETEIENLLTTYSAMAALENGFEGVKQQLFGDGSKKEAIDVRKVSSLRNAIRQNANMPITNENFLTALINGQDPTKASQPTNLDFIRNGSGQVGSYNFAPGRKTYVWYSHGLMSATSVATAGTMGKYSAIVGIYPQTDDEFLDMVQNIYNGTIQNSAVAKRAKSIQGNRILSSKVVDPKWHPAGMGDIELDPDTADIIEKKENATIIDIGKNQSNASFAWLKEVSKLPEGSAYLENPDAVQRFADGDEERFYDYWNAVANNEALIMWAANRLGIENTEDLLGKIHEAVNGKKIYSNLIGEDGDSVSYIIGLAPFYAKSLNYHPVDGVLNRFKNLSSFMQMLVTEIEEEATTQYCVNHYPPPGSGWPESYIAPEIRLTDKTLPLSDRAKTLDPSALAPKTHMVRSGGAAAKVG